MRKKLVIITMAALALLTAQCKKNEPKPSEKVMVPITGTVDFGGSKTEITTTGCINPVVGDKIYIYRNGGNVGYVNCTATSGQQFSCSGEIEEDCLGTTCTFMYLGTGSTDAGGDPIDGNSTTISFANQTSVSVSNGKIANLNQFHVGSCTALVSEQGTVTLPMLSKMAIAYFQLKDMQSNPIANKDITISGLSATATINKGDGALTGNSGDITVRTDASGSFYMALIPQNGSVEFTFSCAGYEDGTRTFSNGIRECNFYSEQGLGSPLQVNMASIPEGALPGVFTVGVDAEGKPIKVHFSKGNLYYDGSNSKWEFEAEQYYFRTYNGKGKCDANGYNKDSGTASTDWGLFGWSTENTNYGMSTSTSGVDYSGNFRDWGTAIDDKGTWKTLFGGPNGEWKYLFDSHVNVWGTCNSVPGRFIAPDGFVGDASALSEAIKDWENAQKSGIVFLPAVGFRSGSNVNKVGDIGYYWSSSAYNEYNANYVGFISNKVYPGNYDNRRNGYSVRLITESK